MHGGFRGRRGRRDGCGGWEYDDQRQCRDDLSYQYRDQRVQQSEQCGMLWYPELRLHSGKYGGVLGGDRKCGREADGCAMCWCRGRCGRWGRLDGGNMTEVMDDSNDSLILL